MTNLWISEYFVRVAQSIHQANVIIAFSVLLASRVRVRQVSPAAERNFLTHLVRYQLLAAWVCTVSYLPLHESSRLKNTVMIFYVVGTTMIFIALNWTSLSSNPHASAQEAITANCVQLLRGLVNLMFIVYL
jgi:hypothetical protein